MGAQIKDLIDLIDVMESGSKSANNKLYYYSIEIKEAQNKECSKQVLKQSLQPKRNRTCLKNIPDFVLNKIMLHFNMYDVFWSKSIVCRKMNRYAIQVASYSTSSFKLKNAQNHLDMKHQLRFLSKHNELAESIKNIEVNDNDLFTNLNGVGSILPQTTKWIERCKNIKLIRIAGDRAGYLWLEFIPYSKLANFLSECHNMTKIELLIKFYLIKTSKDETKNLVASILQTLAKRKVYEESFSIMFDKIKRLESISCLVECKAALRRYPDKVEESRFSEHYMVRCFRRNDFYVSNISVE